MSQNGKGDRNRVSNHKAYSEGYDRIFCKPRTGQLPLKGCSTAMRAKRSPLTSCAADRDGECHHPDCPQIRDGEPEKSDRHCPLDRYGQDDEY